MKFLIIILCVAMALASNPDLDKEWQMWKDTNHKKYEPEEEDYRRFVWEYNYGVVKVHNSRYALGHTSFTMAMNEYADMTNAEFRRKMTGFLMGAPPKRVDSLTDISGLPTEVDWRKKGWVTLVKNQAACGSCWAFSTTGALEGQMMNKTGKLPTLSEQNLVDCARYPKYDCAGCRGGLVTSAFQYVHDNNGIDSEASYPYEGKNDTCRFNLANVAGTDKTHVLIPSMDEKALQKAVATVGPISVTVDSGHMSFQLYHGGVYNEPKCSQTSLDHAVLAVGYGVYENKDYWLVKNSWGTNWGIKGYIMMSRFKDNQCGIATNASYPLV